MQSIKTTIPDSLPLSSIQWEAFVDEIGEARAILSQFDSIIRRVSYPQAVFSLLTYEEAFLSLQSQKVSASFEDLFYPPSSTSDPVGVRKILHYLFALREAQRNIVSHPISFQLLCQIHKKIKRGSKDKSAGKFRTKQNWIGPEGCSIEEAYFYPPKVEILHSAMANLKKYLPYKEKDPIVQLAIFFAQLLVIHPFMDGNGRVGRILIPLFLYKKKLLSSPLFYLSDYFKHHRLTYFEKLFAITTEHNWEEWIRFFLKGVIEEGKKNCAKAEAILSLYRTVQEERQQTPQIDRALSNLFACPILSMTEWEKKKKNWPWLKDLEEKKWVVQDRIGSRVIVKKLLTLDLFKREG